jgi:hypothetical protein
MYLLIPGRHHIITRFQAQYLFRLIHSNLSHDYDIHGNPLKTGTIEGIIFAVTSANHQKTRRNPLTFTHRVLAIHSLNRELSVPVFSYPVNDTGNRDDFASHTLKTIYHASEGLLNLTPDNTLVICSTPVLKLYENMGFTIFGAEIPDVNSQQIISPLPWNIVEAIASSKDWEKDPYVLSHIYPGSLEILSQYNLGKTIQFVFNDPIVGDDGDLTETRDYSSYVRQMDEIAGLKWQDVKKYVSPGRIGDIGCSAGSWLKLATEEPSLTESDFYGIEVARQLFQTCEQRKSNGEFATPNIWFSQKNAVTDLVFQKNSMNTIHSSSLTHEIESYGSREELITFIGNRYSELQPGGVWINRDVIGPENKEELCLLLLNSQDGDNRGWDGETEDSGELHTLLSGLSTLALFYRFAADFRASEGYRVNFRKIERGEKLYIELKMEDAAEFLLTKDYTDNWKSEMHERFCFWSLSDWNKAMCGAGFYMHPDSYAFTNPWIVENRFQGKAQLFSLDGEIMDFPVTNGIMVGCKI